MTIPRRKNRTWDQKKKRRASHKLGKQFKGPTNNENCEPMNPLLKTKVLLATNKEYRKAAASQSLGSLLVFSTMIYFFVGVLYYFSIKMLKSYALQVVLKVASLGFLKPSYADQFREPIVWEVFKRYTMGKPIIVGIVILLLLVIGVFLSVKGEKKQTMIAANTKDEDLRKDYEKLIRKAV